MGEIFNKSGIKPSGPGALPAATSANKNPDLMFGWDARQRDLRLLGSTGSQGMREFQCCRVDNVGALDLGKVTKNNASNLLWGFCNGAISVLSTWDSDTPSKSCLAPTPGGENRLDGLPLRLGVQFRFHGALGLGFQEGFLVLLRMLGDQLAELESHRLCELLEVAKSQKLEIQECRANH